MPGPNHVLIFHNFIQVSTDKHLGGGSLERIDLCNDRLNLFSWFLFFKKSFYISDTCGPK